MIQPVRFSMELFPPRTPEGALKLPAMVGQLARLQPEFFSVTYGAAGSQQSGTYDTLIDVARHTGVETAPHLTCIGATRASVATLIERYLAAGVRRIVALRGDLPAGSSADTGEFSYASDLVRFIRAEFGRALHIEVAAYPEMHPQAANPDADFAHFCAKVEAGADGALTQLFFDVGAYIDFVERCRRAGQAIDIVPGIMPITNYAGLARFCAGCGADLPRWVRLRLEALQDDKTALADFGTEVVSRLCEQLLAAGAPGLHFYTLNLAEPTLRIWQRLGLPLPVE